MKRRTIPRFKGDREAAAFWDRRASTSYLADLEAVTVQILPALRKRVVTRSKPKKGPQVRVADEVSPTGAVTIRLAPEKVAALKGVAHRKNVRCEDLIETWIMAGLEQDQAG